jgi:uncharacterized protein (DUF433 family)
MVGISIDDSLTNYPTIDLDWLIVKQYVYW